MYGAIGMEDGSVSLENECFNTPSSLNNIKDAFEKKTLGSY